MLRGVYTAASGLNAEMLEQDVVANNIANADTVGFKKDTPVLAAFPNQLLNRIHDRMDADQAQSIVALPAIVAENLPHAGARFTVRLPILGPDAVGAR